MIFVTVGTQLAFPRLIDAMDRVASLCGETVVAQAGPDGAGQAGRWPHIELHGHLAPAEFDELFGTARVVVAHAGIGSILSARRLGRPLVVVPRRHALGEHRNDHQMATARQIAALPGIHVAWETEELMPLLARHDLEPASERPSAERAALVSRLRAFIEG